MPHRTIALRALCAAMLAFGAQASFAGEASEQLSGGSALIVGSPVGSLVGASQAGAGGLSDGAAMAIVGGYYVVSSSVEIAARTVEVAFKSASTGARFSARLATDAAGAASLAVGSTVEAVSTAAGTALTASGRVLAFIPNEAGAALFAQKRMGAQ